MIFIGADLFAMDFKDDTEYTQGLEPFTDFLTQSVTEVSANDRGGRV